MLESGKASQLTIQASNVLGGELKSCGKDPVTGYYRDGSCFSDQRDSGNHSVCAVMTDEFLQYSKSKGNDLITLNRRYGFPGLKAGDRWCLCAARWLEAHQVGIAPKPLWESSHLRLREVIPDSIIRTTQE